MQLVNDPSENTTITKQWRDRRDVLFSLFEDKIYLLGVS